MKKVLKCLVEYLLIFSFIFLSSIMHMRMGASVNAEAHEIPRNIHDAMDLLDRAFDDRTKEKILYYSKIPETQLSDSEIFEKSNYDHLGLGMWIRNSWELWSDSRLKRWFLWRGIVVPDVISKRILDEYILHLEGGSNHEYILNRILVILFISFFLSMILHLIKFIIYRR